MFLRETFHSAESEEETKLESWERERVQEKHVLHNLCATVKMRDLYLALLLYYFPYVHVSVMTSSVGVVFISVHLFIAFLFILHCVSDGMKEASEIKEREKTKGGRAG